MQHGSKIFYCLSVKLVDKVPMLESKRKQAAEWLKQWTPKNNFKAVITEYKEEAIEVFRKELARTCEHVGYPPGNFEFNLYSTDVVLKDNLVQFDWNAEAAARCVETDINAGGLE